MWEEKGTTSWILGKTAFAGKEKRIRNDEDQETEARLRGKVGENPVMHSNRSVRRAGLYTPIETLKNKNKRCESSRLKI